ncbi:hypothetical protein O6P43_009253 [Quillaja saponaria]|uniref:Uncharacterized protein n=1 Tax=Quillaja saponaria TaxID=32244 RepID=A0AAD7VCF1_QUISA|nr:hypothetical protein O6P43_009253 [Quillaja saponaria]
MKAILLVCLLLASILFLSSSTFARVGPHNVDEREGGEDPKIVYSSPLVTTPHTRVVTNPPTRVVTNPHTRVVINPPTRVVTAPPTRVVTAPPTRVVTNPHTPVVTNPRTPVVTNPRTPVAPRDPYNRILPKPPQGKKCPIYTRNC